MKQKNRAKLRKGRLLTQDALRLLLLFITIKKMVFVHGWGLRVYYCHFYFLYHSYLYFIEEN